MTLHKWEFHQTPCPNELATRFIITCEYCYNNIEIKMHMIFNKDKKTFYLHTAGTSVPQELIWASAKEELYRTATKTCEEAIMQEVLV